jgi:hypothetical protein
MKRTGLLPAPNTLDGLSRTGNPDASTGKSNRNLPHLTGNRTRRPPVEDRCISRDRSRRTKKFPSTWTKFPFRPATGNQRHRIEFREQFPVSLDRLRASQGSVRGFQRGNREFPPETRSLWTGHTTIGSLECAASGPRFSFRVIGFSPHCTQSVRAKPSDGGSGGRHASDAAGSRICPPGARLPCRCSRGRTVLRLAEALR